MLMFDMMTSRKLTTSTGTTKATLYSGNYLMPYRARSAAPTTYAAGAATSSCWSVVYAGKRHGRVCRKTARSGIRFKNPDPEQAGQNPNHDLDRRGAFHPYGPWIRGRYQTGRSGYVPLQGNGQEPGNSRLTCAANGRIRCMDSVRFRQVTVVFCIFLSAERP